MYWEMVMKSWLLSPKVPWSIWSMSLFIRKVMRFELLSIHKKYDTPTQNTPSVRKVKLAEPTDNWKEEDSLYYRESLVRDLVGLGGTRRKTMYFGQCFFFPVYLKNARESHFWHFLRVFSRTKSKKTVSRPLFFHGHFFRFFPRVQNSVSRVDFFFTGTFLFHSLNF